MRRSVSAVANRHGERPTPETRSGIATGLELTGTRPPRSRIAVSRGLDAGFGNPNQLAASRRGVCPSPSTRAPAAGTCTCGAQTLVAISCTHGCCRYRPEPASASWPTSVGGIPVPAAGALHCPLLQPGMVVAECGNNKRAGDVLFHGRKSRRTGHRLPLCHKRERGRAHPETERGKLGCPQRQNLDCIDRNHTVLYSLAVQN